MSVRKASDDLLVRNASTNVPAVPTDGTKRKLTGDAQWKIIQKDTFTRWTNERLKTVTKHVTDLETDLSDGLRLIALVEVLSGKRFPKFNNSPNIRTMKLENVAMALKFLQVDEGIKIVNIDSSDIVDHNLKLILGLIWTLILHYSNSMPLWEDDEGRPQKQEQTPKQRLFGWSQGRLPDRPVGNLTTDWNDGKAFGALVDGVAPGVEQLEKQLDATNMNLKEANRRIEHLEDLQKTMDSIETELKESKRENEILKENNKILNQEMERNSKLALEVEQLKKELNETNLKLQEAKRRTEHLDDLQKTIETELIDAKREIENLKEEKIMKQELESNTKLECTVRYEGTTEVAVNKDFVPDSPARTFDDSSMLRARDRTFIVGMKLHIRLWGTDEVIGAMEVFYNTGQSVVHGSKNPKTAVIDEEFFVGEGEFITEIDVQSGWMLDRLRFTTNKGIVYGPYGGDGGGRRRFVCPCEGAYLAYITGSVDDTWGATAVRRLRFFWGVPK